MRIMTENHKNWQKKGVRIFESFYYILARYAFVFITFFFGKTQESVFWRDNKEQRFAHEWVYWTTSFSVILLIDLIVHFVFYGAQSILKLKKEYIYEIFLQVVFWISWIIYFSVDELDIDAMIKLVNIMSLVFFFRLPVVVVLLWELKGFRVIVETGMRFFSPFMSVLFSLYLILFAYSEIGVLLYCQKITLYDFSDIDNNGNPLYALLNFNDLASGMLTNFAILVSNNWNSFTDMFSAFVGNNIGPRFYFGFFFMLSIMVFLNIVVSFIMEIYEVTLEKLEADSDKMENVSTIM